MIQMPMPHSGVESGCSSTGIDGLHAITAKGSLLLGKILRLPGGQRSQHTRGLLSREGVPAVRALGEHVHGGESSTISVYCQYWSVAHPSPTHDDTREGRFQGCQKIAGIPALVFLSTHFDAFACIIQYIDHQVNRHALATRHHRGRGVQIPAPPPISTYLRAVTSVMRGATKSRSGSAAAARISVRVDSSSAREQRPAPTSASAASSSDHSRARFSLPAR